MVKGNSYAERMPAPERTSNAAVLAAARSLVEEFGPAGLTMQAVADRVGVRPPSLYKRVRDRDELVRRVVTATVEELGARLAAVAAVQEPAATVESTAAITPDAAVAALDAAAPVSASPTAALASAEPAPPAGVSTSTAPHSDQDARRLLATLARALRAFAHEHPACFSLALGPLTPAQRPPVELLQRASAPVLTVASQLTGPAHALHAARTLTAWANGFLLMELAGSFRLGGEVDAAYEWGLQRVIASIGPE